MRITSCAEVARNPFLPRIGLVQTPSNSRKPAFPSIYQRELEHASYSSGSRRSSFEIDRG